MANNITSEDVETLIEFLRGRPRLTQSHQVEAFEVQWSDWLGVDYSVYVNSGSSANLITLAALRHLYGPGEIIVPVLTWVSDIASVLQNGFTPVFVDINLRTLCMDDELIIRSVSEKTRAVFMTHVQGFNGLTHRLLSFLDDHKIPLIEDVCESHGATFEGRKLGAFGLASNFSFYYAHHMSTIEGGMVCTSDESFYQAIRMFRSHGMVREMSNSAQREEYAKAYPYLTPDFIFAFPAYNVRGTEIGAILGRSQLPRLDENIRRRNENLRFFLDHLNADKYRVDFALDGCSNYALPLILREGDPVFRDRVEVALHEAGIEFRRGSSGGGNQLRQPYLKGIVDADCWAHYPEVEHIHFYGYYIGNYPDLPIAAIEGLCQLLNGI